MDGLFKFNDLESKEENNETLLIPNVLKIKNPIIKTATGLSKKTIAMLMPELEKDTQWHFPSFGEWSAHHTLCHLLDLAGPSDVCLTSWAISEESIRQIINYQNSGQIRELSCLFDNRVRTYAPNAWQMAEHSFSKIALAPCHAKVMVIKNENWQFAVISSANFSNNRRTECYVICESKAIAEFHYKWITEKINQSSKLDASN